MLLGVQLYSSAIVRPCVQRQNRASSGYIGGAKRTDTKGPWKMSRILPTERIDYSPISDRPHLALPGNARMVVWVIVNIEEWNPLETMPRTVLTPPAGGSPMPDIPNWAWHEYGNRVGF